MFSGVTAQKPAAGWIRVCPEISLWGRARSRPARGSVGPPLVRPLQFGAGNAGIPRRKTLNHQETDMGVADHINWVDAACWNGTAFDGGWNTRLAENQDVLEPATGKALWRVGVASGADMTAAIGRAHEAQRAWAATSPRERAAIMHKAAELFEQHFDELSLMIARETGGIMPKGQHEVRESVVLCRLAAAMPMQAQGQVLPSTPGRLSIARRVPHGVVGVISPFNFPLILSLRSVAPALALGNAVVLKPDVRTPASGGFIIARVFQEAACPPVCCRCCRATPRRARRWSPTRGCR
jgi:acyl-CoA reductase-like NAD-dependent aldehyde dehydrogenase